ncbi:YciI family protein [Nonomuraea sp. NPDC050790]|uniref:YciI family protein n=1 Tax=Nonomuraea sp. NPDC050790 TaxID=3364371 RepID=UPI00379D7679
MKFALVYQYDPAQTSPTEAEIPEWMELDKQLRESGELVYDCGFHAVDAARTLSLRDGAENLSDGVAATSGNVAAGFVVVDVPDVEAALTWARKIPTARYGAVDVRPLVEWEG